MTDKEAAHAFFVGAVCAAICLPVMFGIAGGVWYAIDHIWPTPSRDASVILDMDQARARLCK